jgi:hypothetical protein
MAKNKLLGLLLRKERPRQSAVREGGMKSFWNWLSSHRRENHYPFKQHIVARLAAFAIGVLWVRFIWKKFLMTHFTTSVLADFVTIISTIATVLGLVAGFIVVGSTLWFVTNAPDGQIDERERAEKNRSYQLAYQYIMGLMATGVVLLEFAPGIYEDLTGTVARQPDLGTLQLFVVSIFLTGLLLPTLLLAIQSPSEESDENQ